MSRVRELGGRALAAMRSIGSRRATVALLVAIAAGSPWWGPPLLSELAFFRVRKVEVIGVRYLGADEVFRRLAVDTAASVWDDLDPLRERVIDHPQVADARVSRRLPGTLVVRVTENLPVALVATREGMHPIDATGRALPFDPSRVEVDLPVVIGGDSAVARLLAAVRERDPAMFDRISDVRVVDDDQIVLTLGDLRVRAAPDLSPARFADILPVEEDLARRGARVLELDLRFRDQVIARLQ